MSGRCIGLGSGGKRHATPATSGGGGATDSTLTAVPPRRGLCAGAAAGSCHTPLTAKTPTAAVAAAAAMAAAVVEVDSMRTGAAGDTATRATSRRVTSAAREGSCCGGWSWASRNMMGSGRAEWASLCCPQRQSRGALEA